MRYRRVVKELAKEKLTWRRPEESAAVVVLDNVLANSRMQCLVLGLPVQVGWDQAGAVSLGHDRAWTERTTSRS
jgi:hypothetical protein